MGPLYPNSVHVLVSRNSPARSLADLAGGRISVGSAGAGTEQTARQILAAYGLSYDDIQPRYLSFLSLMLVPGTALHRRAEEGSFVPPRPADLLREARGIVEGLELEGTVFRSDHASNHLPLRGRLPRDRDALLDALDSALAGMQALRPEPLRGL